MYNCISAAMPIAATVSFFLFAAAVLYALLCILILFFLLMIYLKYLSIAWDLFHGVSL